MNEENKDYEIKSIKEKTESMKKFEGFYSFYWDEKRGKIWLEIDRLDKEFLYYDSLRAGIGSNDIGLDRNQLGNTKIVRFTKIGPKILLIESNYGFRAISDDPNEVKAVEEAFAGSVIWGFEVKAEEDKKYLVDITKFLLRDSKNVIKRLKEREQGEFELDETRSALYLPMTKNFPKNSEFEALLTFTGKNPGDWVKSVVPDPDSITVRLHHSFIQLPDNDYTPRKFDPRASFFATTWNDYATPIDQPLKQRYITRFRLKKKDPKAKMSEAVKPIIFYVDHATPEPVRSALLEGASWWNNAFENIGYKDAFQVKILPEEADPLDIRYNVINWIHRSTRGWSYGMVIRDPRTGEILKGHVSLGSLRIRQDYLLAEGLVADYSENKNECQKAFEMALARIRQLSVHEVGHAIGLGHNYASNINGRSSVMDYPAPLALLKKDGGIDLSKAYETDIGDWDKAAIEYGYQDFPPDIDENKKLNENLEAWFKKGILYAPGQDAGPDSAHPLAASWVNGKNHIEELERLMALRSYALKKFDANKIRIGSPMATLEEVLVPLYLCHRYQLEATASIIGGIYYHHTIRGGVQSNPKIVPVDEQRNALDAMLKTIQPTALALPENILNLIPPRPPSYEQTRDLFPGRTGLTFDSLTPVENAADMTIGLILNPKRTARIVEYHARDTKNPPLTEVIDILLEETWEKKHDNPYHIEVQHVVNNVLLYHLIRLASDGETLNQVKGITSMKLRELKEWLEEHLHLIKNESQKANWEYAIDIIKIFQENPKNVNLSKPLTHPMGQPI